MGDRVTLGQFCQTWNPVVILVLQRIAVASIVRATYPRYPGKGAAVLAV